jgi:hypothetical protein
MALLFLDGFDHYATADLEKKWSTLESKTPSPIISSAAARTGTQGLTLTVTQNEEAAVLSVIVAPTTAASGVAGFALRVSGTMSLLHAFNRIFHVFAGDTTQFGLRLNSDGTVSVRLGASGTILGTTTAAIPLDTWTYVECKWTIHDTTGSIQVRFNGQRVLDLINVETQASVTAAWTGVALCGLMSIIGSGSYTVQYDDFYLSDQATPNRDFLGALRVDAHYPNAAGTYSQWIRSTGTDQWATVDEAQQNGDTDYNTATAVPDLDTLHFPNLINTGATIKGVQVCCTTRNPGSGQVFVVLMPNGTGSVPTYTGPTFSTYAWTAAAYAVPWRVAGSFRNAYIELPAAPGSGKSWTYTLVKNGVDTAMVVVITGLTTLGWFTASDVVVAPGDLLYWRRTPGGSLPTGSWLRATVEFHATNPFESGYGSADIDISPSASLRGPVFFPHQWNTGNLGGSNHEVISIAGVFAELTYLLSTAPGVGKSHQFVLYVNGVKQDGSGGTVDTRVTLADLATTGSWTGSVSVAAGDWVVLEQTPTGSPTSAFASYGVKFVASVAGAWVCGNLPNASLPAAGNTAYATPTHQISGSGVSPWDTLETDVDIRVGAYSSFVLRQLRVRVGSTLTGPVTWTLRKNGIDTALSVTIASAATGADLVNEVSVAPGDRLSMKCVVGGSPGFFPASFSMLSGASAGEITGMVRSGATFALYEPVGQAISPIYRVHRFIFETIDDQSWTETGFNAAQFGYRKTA